MAMEWALAGLPQPGFFEAFLLSQIVPGNEFKVSPPLTPLVGEGETGSLRISFQGSSSWAFGPAVKHEKVGGAGVRACQAVRTGWKPVPPGELFRTAAPEVWAHP